MLPLIFFLKKRQIQPLTLLPSYEVFGCLHDEAIHARQQQASEKRRGTKSRGAGHCGGQQLISGLWGFEEHAGGGECPAQWCERIVSPFWEAHWPGYSGRKADPPVCTEAILSCRGACHGKRRRGRSKPSSNRGQYCGLETAMTAS